MARNVKIVKNVKNAKNVGNARNPKKKATAARAARGVPVALTAAVRAQPAKWIVALHEQRLWLAFGISLAMHAAVLWLPIAFPEPSRAFQAKTLDIILVNSKSARKPDKAQVLAQSNLDGGGNTDQDRRVKTPLPPSPKQQKGEELEKAEKRIQALEVKQKKLLAQARSKEVVAPPVEAEAQPEPQPQPTSAPTLSGRDLASSALEMMRLEGQIAKQTDEYNKRPRKKHITTRAAEYRFARYVEDWRIKVERVGTLNFPEAAKGKTYGTLILTVSIKKNGAIEGVEINKSSGYKILDEAARRIVTIAGPYAEFPPDIQRDTDILVITRAWKFLRGNQLETENSR